MNDTKRRTFRPRNQRSGFRPRNNNGHSSSGHFKSNGNGNNGRNTGSMTNPFAVEKTAQKFQQLAKDALTTGDPVLYENYLQHAEHYNRRLAELNTKPKETKIENSNSVKLPVEPSIEKKEKV
jgi:hypothetical protein|tara:strand:+ start:247 stop:615 length:369 start_codon:yes stop_codon:yes gene_type:complete